MRSIQKQEKYTQCQTIKYQNRKITLHLYSKNTTLTAKKLEGLGTFVGDIHFHEIKDAVPTSLPTFLSIQNICKLITK
jgi:hypothetical protein